MSSVGCPDKPDTHLLEHVHRAAGAAPEPSTRDKPSTHLVEHVNGAAGAVHVEAADALVAPKTLLFVDVHVHLQPENAALRCLDGPINPQQTELRIQSIASRVRILSWSWMARSTLSKQTLSLSDSSAADLIRYGLSEQLSEAKSRYSRAATANKRSGPPPPTNGLGRHRQ